MQSLLRPSWKRLTLLDVIVATSLAVATVALYLWRFGAGVTPEEDAAILMRYVRHVAAGQGIVWNVGEGPVDGATDFLFMMAAALLVRSGLTVESAVRGLGLAAHALTVVLLYVSIRGLFGSRRTVALFPAAFLLLGPAPHYVAVCFGTPFFALSLASTWVAAHFLMGADPPGKAAAWLFGLSALISGLIRPEGVIATGLMLLAILLYRRGRDARAIVGPFAAAVLGLGLVYFLWRWNYFGHPLPNPFYRKGGGSLYWATLGKAFQNLARLTWPFTLVLGAGLAHRPTRRYAAAALLPVAGFGAAWVLLSDETNYLMRFRYPIALLALISWAPVWDRLREDVLATRAVPAARTVAGVLAGAAALGTLAWQHGRYAGIQHVPSGMHDVGVILAAYRERGYTLAVTEAGLVPFYSDWRTVDAWGLNDPWITHHGGITADYLERYRPDLIMIHAYYSPQVPRDHARSRGLGEAWHRMAVTLHDYAEAQGYELAAVFGRDPYETHYYFVRPGCPDRPELVALIRGLDYAWFRDGEPATNFVSAMAR